MNSDALRRRAMALGAKLEIDGKTFNAGRMQGIHTPPPKLSAATPVVAPVVAPVVKSDTSLESIAQFAAATYLLQEGVAAELAAMQKQIGLLTDMLLAKPEKQPDREYSIIRDRNGDMDSIQVTSKS